MPPRRRDLAPRPRRRRSPSGSRRWDRDMAGYLTATGIEGAIAHLASTYSTLCQLITLPESSVEHRAIHAIKIANGSGTGRRGVLLIGGVHAREVVNPDLLV